MSEFSIRQYQNEVEKIIHFGGTKKETAIRNAFYNLLKRVCTVSVETMKIIEGMNRQVQ